MKQAPSDAAYARLAREYVDAVGRIEHVSPLDLSLIEAWARDLDGPALDVGCGPGQWTNHLATRGVDVEGVEPVLEFIAEARITYPGVRYRHGRAEALDVASGSLGGILAWYSLIHTPPEDIGMPLAEFARCLRPEGGLVLGFFASAELAPFDHAVATAYAWPVAALSAKVREAGFRLRHTETRTGPRSRRHGAIVAVRS